MSDSSIVGQIALELNLDTNTFRRQLRNLGNTANNTAKSMTNSFSGVFKKIAAGAVAAFSVTAIVNFGRTCIKTANEVENAWIGLNSIVNGQGKSFDTAKKFIQEYISDGLVPLKDAVIAYKNLSLRGYNEEQIQTVMNAFKNSATYARQSQYSLGEAISTATEGLKNENSIVVDNAGVTKNVAKMWRDYAKSIGVSSTSLTKQQKIEAEVAGIIEETKYQMGDAARYADTYSGRIAKLNASFTNLKVKIGNILKVVVNVFIPIINSAVNAIEKMVDKLTEVLNFFGVQTNITGTLQSISDTAEASNTGIEDTTKSAQKLKKTLAGFDQLNILSEDNNNSDSDDTSNSANTSTAMELDTSSAQSGTESLIDDIQKKLQSLFKNSGFDDFVSEIQKGISDVDFVSIKENFQSVMQSLQRIAQAKLRGTQKIFKSTMKTLGKVIGGTAKAAGKSIQTISGGVTKWLEKDKGKIVEYIDTISTNISSGIDSVGNFVDSVCDTSGKSIDRMRPQMENAIAQMLSGITTFTGSVGIMFSGAFSIATGVIAKWAEDNKATIGTFFDNVQKVCADSMNGVGTVFEDVGNIMTSWWGNGGSQMWEGMCKVVTDFGSMFLNIFDSWIMPVWNDFKEKVSDVWQNTIRPVFENLMSLISQLWNDIIQPFWDNVLKPLVNWIVQILAPYIQNAFHTIWSIIQTVFQRIGGVINGAITALRGLIDFISGVFSGNWEKAWNGIKDIVSGVWNAIWSVIKGVINIIIDGINAIWGGIYSFAKGVVDTIGGISGAIGKVFGQDWSFSLPDEIPYIPKLAKGGLVTAPTLALVGDNKNAASDPEVVSPLSKLRDMIGENGSNQNEVQCDERIIRLLQRIYDLLNSEETQYVNNIYLDSDVIEHKLVKVRKRKSRRYGGATT